MIYRIACFSDTHTQHLQVDMPKCDLAIFAGDSTDRGGQYQTFDFLDWFNKQYEATHKVMIAGNHEVAWDAEKYTHNAPPDWTTGSYFELTYPNVKYLNNSSVNIWGLNIWGSPVTPNFFPEYWGFNKSRGAEIRKVWDQIPSDTDILISHGPMRGSLDWIANGGHNMEHLYPSGNVGCDDLRDKVYSLPNLKLFVCGHIHDNTATLDIPIGSRNLKYVNAACLTNRYQFRHQPQVVEIEIP